jgi:hypothetical protein
MNSKGENGAFLFAELWEPGFEKTLQGDFELNKAGGLVPYRVRVYPKTGGAPYMTTRWRKPGALSAESPIHVVPAAAYQGSLIDVYHAWQGFLGTQEKLTDALMQPLVAMQEILFKGRLGLLAIQDNRVLGVAVIQQGSNLLTASPIDQLRGNTNAVIDTLTQGLNAYEVQ